jgi:hypothetical protein
MILLYGLALYLCVGIVTAVAFVIFGATRVLDHPVSMTIGARILLLPASAVLWPYILVRWIRSSRAQ